MINKELQKDLEKHGFHNRIIKRVDENGSHIILCIDGTVTTKYEYKSKKNLNSDWTDLIQKFNLLKGKNIESKEQTTASSSGSFEAAFSGGTVKRKINKINNSKSSDVSEEGEIQEVSYESLTQTIDHIQQQIWGFHKRDTIRVWNELLEKELGNQWGDLVGDKGRIPVSKLHKVIHIGRELLKRPQNEQEVAEVTDASSSGAYDVPLFGGTKGRKNPLAIGGVASIKNSRAVKDKNFPKWGGPGGVFVKIKDKCKKFPYCNQGDINAIEELKEAVSEVSIKLGIPYKEVEKIVLNEIKLIFI